MHDQTSPFEALHVTSALLSSQADDMRALVEARLAALVPQAIEGQAGLGRAVNESLLAPGKRLRPLLTLCVARDLGGIDAPAIDAGCAVEMVHAASLILDDMPCMDDAALRRGLPAAHVSHGQDVALLAAIALLSGAFGVLAGIETASPQARTRAVAILSRHVGTAGLVGGQFADLHGGRASRSLAEIARANRLKTAALFHACVEIGAVMAGADEARTRALQGFARELGEAFQLLDDLLDTGSNPFLIGKDTGKDAGKSTIVSMVGRACVERRIARHRESAEAILATTLGPGSRTGVLVAAIFAAAHPVDGTSDETPRLEEEAALR